MGWVKRTRTIGLNGKIIIMLSTHKTTCDVGTWAVSGGNTGESPVHLAVMGDHDRHASESSLP